MKLATFDAGAGPQPGAVDVDRPTIVALDGFRSALELIDGGDTALLAAADLERPRQHVRERVDCHVPASCLDTGGGAEGRADADFTNA